MAGGTRRLLLVGLGILAGAVLHAPLAAQEPVPRRDSTVTIPIPPQPDTLVRRDSIPGDSTVPRIRGDSIQSPFARAPLPVVPPTSRPALVWRRDSILATGAITLADLLERVPGLATLRVGWLGAPAFAAYLGDVARVRVFVDGLELDPQEPRGGATLDVTRMPLWLVDEMRIEHTAGELRVHVRSWDVERTTPYSRVDVATGDQDTDVFRFFFGRRFGNGLGVQAAVDQFSTTPDRLGATNSQTSLFGRVGWARGAWKADATVLRQAPRRGVLFDDTGTDSIPGIDLTRTDAYVRAGFGDADGPAWVQLTAGAHGYRYTGVRDPEADSVIVEVDPVTGDTTFIPITADTSRFVPQYVASAGVNLGPLRATAAHRVRLADGETFHTPSIRVGVQWGAVAAAASAEARGIDSVARVDATVNLQPLPFFRVGGSAAFRDDARADATGTDLRAEAALRLGRTWIGGGVMSRAAALLRAPRLLDADYTAVAGPAARGAFASIHGPLWGPLQVDLLGEAWEDEGFAYRPRFATRADLFVRSNFLGRFPTGNFGLYALIRHEYRSAAFFPTADAVERTPGHRILTGLLEIRILDATLSYQFRNLVGTRFQTVPGYQMPRQTQYYGVRWAFWN